MIRECPVHGYFSDDDLCPACNSEGKFIMSTRERDGMARKLALVLRHAPEKFDLEMDINGWIDVRDIVRIQRRWQAQTTLAEAPPSSCYLRNRSKGKI